MHVGGTNSRPRREPLAAAIIVLILAGMFHGGPGEASELEDRTAPSQDQHIRRVVREMERSARLGPPGTVVSVKTGLLPALTPVQLVIGGTQSGFEGLALGQTDAEGNFEGVVEVPSWSKRDQLHRFIVFNLYFSTVLAESTIFHVTDADGAIVREGHIGSSGSECTTLEGNDGERYRLIGATDELEAGTRVVVEGVISESDESCGEGLSLDLTLVSIR